MKRLVVDVDNTICFTSAGDYENAQPDHGLIRRLTEYKQQGFEIVLFSSRNMRTYDRKIGLINVHTLPPLLEWLDRHKVPYDEVILGKPWCGTEGFYVDDRAVRPAEFKNMSYVEISELLG